MYSDRLLDELWDRADTIRGRNPDTWRRDEEGNIIRWGSYGTTGDFGWEVDHRHPKADGGSENIRNLRALHWQENREKSDQ